MNHDKRYEKVLIQRYIEAHGFGEPSLPLTPNLTVTQFREQYFSVSELKAFCKTRGIATWGTKPDLNQRIETFLASGKVIKVPPPQKPQSLPDSQAGLSPQKVVIHYKSDLATRQFLKAQIPGFKGFDAGIQQWIRSQLASEISITYGDIIAAYQAKLSGKANTCIGRRVAHPSCQLNQFMIDYADDVSKKMHTAKEAWQLVKHSSGAKTYQRYKSCISEIQSILGLTEPS